MTEVMPVEHPWLEMENVLDGVTGVRKWVLSSGQTSPLLDSGNAVALVFITNGKASENDLDLTGTGWVSLLDHYTHHNTGNLRFQVLAANTDEVGAAPEIPVSGSAIGMDRAARMVLVDNARVSGVSSTHHPITPSEGYAGSKQVLIPNPLPEGKQRRINLFFSWGPYFGTGWQVALNAGYLATVPGTNRVWQRQVGSNPDYSQNWYVIPDPSGVFDSAGGYDHTVQYRSGENYHNNSQSFIHSIGIAYSDPNLLCNDPSHAPVTITITAHGPVDVQVDPAE